MSASDLDVPVRDVMAKGVVSTTDVVRLGVRGHPTAEQAVAAETRWSAGDAAGDDLAETASADEPAGGDYWRALVFEGERLAGIVTSMDVVRAAAGEA